MFTLKLFRRLPDPGADADDRIRTQKQTKVIAAHHVVTIEMGTKKSPSLELWAFHGPEPSSYDAYYIGEPSEGMDDFGKTGLHLESGPYSWWGWGLLENWEGNTSEHYRPGSYG